MFKYQLTVGFGSLEEMAAFLSGGGAGNGSVLTTTSPSSPPPGAPPNAPPAPPPGPPAASAPPAPAGSPPPPAAPPAPPASVAPPAPPPAPAAPPAAPANGLQGEVLQAMQAWSKAGHKAAGIKRVLTKAGIASVSANTPPATLEWLKWAFTTLDASGAYLTPEYIESLQ